MTVWFFDLSNHNNTPSLDGWDGVIAKASEGSGFKDARFWQHINAAREAGKVHAGYHFLRSDAPIKDQAETFMSVCPQEIAAVPDVEWIKDERTGRIISAPTLQQTHEFVDRLLQKGYHVPMQYLPRWYWNYWGQPDLTGLPLLWGSYYPDYVARPREDAWKMIPASAKLGFGGLAMVAVQYTSSPLDQNRSEYTAQQFYDFLSTTRRVDMPLNRVTDKEEFNALMENWWRFHSRLFGSRPTWEDGLTAPEALNTLLNRAVADVDEAALAEEFQKRGIDMGGINMTELKQGVAEVLARSRVTVDPETPAP